MELCVPNLLSSRKSHPKWHALCKVHSPRACHQTGSRLHPPALHCALTCLGLHWSPAKSHPTQRPASAWCPQFFSMRICTRPGANSRGRVLRWASHLEQAVPGRSIVCESCEQHRPRKRTPRHHTTHNNSLGRTSMLNCAGPFRAGRPSRRSLRRYPGIDVRDSLQALLTILAAQDVLCRATAHSSTCAGVDSFCMRAQDRRRDLYRLQRAAKLRTHSAQCKSTKLQLITP